MKMKVECPDQASTEWASKTNVVTDCEDGNNGIRIEYEWVGNWGHIRPQQYYNTNTSLLRVNPVLDLVE